MHSQANGVRTNASAFGACEFFVRFVFLAVLVVEVVAFQWVVLIVINDFMIGGEVYLEKPIHIVFQWDFFELSFGFVFSPALLQAFMVGQLMFFFIDLTAFITDKTYND